MVLLYFVLAALAVGLLTGGRLARLGSVHIEWAGLAIGGLLVQAILFSPPVAATVGRAGPLLYVGSTLAVLVALLRNARQPGLWLLAVGALLNLIVILANGGFMPVSPGALAALGSSAPQAYSNVATASTGTALAWLGDVFVVPPPIPFANAISPGDVLIGLGAAWFLVATLRRSDPEPAQALLTGS